MMLTQVNQSAVDAGDHFRLAELSLFLGRWSEAITQLSAAIQSDSDFEHAGSARAARDYIAAITDNDEDSAHEAYSRERSHLDKDPEDGVAAYVVVHWLLRSDNGTQALPIIEALIQRQPHLYQYDELKLAALQDVGDNPRIGAQLASMHAKYPERRELSGWYVAWLEANSDIRAASDILFAETQKESRTETSIPKYVEFLQRHGGDGGAAKRLQELLDAGELTVGEPDFRLALADLWEKVGNVPFAVRTLEAVVEGGDGTGKRSDAIVRLARLLDASGDRQRARSEIDRLLGWDSENSAALKIRARWNLEDGLADDALRDLLGANLQLSRDAEYATLLGEVYLLQGLRTLAGQQFALAYEYSRGAAPEAKRLANHLISELNYGSADLLLETALDRHPENVELLKLAITVASELGDEVRSASLTERLRVSDDAAASVLNGDTTEYRR
ncbi:hypothetical protein EF888_08700 [Silicimonas algicola]|uniref:Tetratricopeptide repeat protein n=1 Tax=Silicimonas algicola TaxID=1826607 RepID=A0A316GB13_9RHOB|nr:hypothetical protein EF888_08700 [Silicimonas algicola]PWK56860.1 hypothetical protein C8D95_10392 [Silicimonas algicola]